MYVLMSLFSLIVLVALFIGIILLGLAISALIIRWVWNSIAKYFVTTVLADYHNEKDNVDKYEKKYPTLSYKQAFYLAIVVLAVHFLLIGLL